MSTNEAMTKSWRSERRERRHNGITGGLILVALGIIFLAQQTGWFQVDNWWALFILIPAVGSFGTCLALYSRNGLTQGVRDSFFGGMFFLAVSLMFLFDLSWAVYWPVFVILPGMSLFFAGLPLGGDYRFRTARAFARPWAIGTGLAMMLLGAGFLLQNLGILEPEIMHPRWWSLVIYLPAIGGLFAALGLMQEEGGFGPAAAASLAGAVVVGAVATIALLGLNWNLLWPLALIAAGCVVLLGVLGGRRSAEL